MDVVDTWTGELAAALQRAFRMSNDALATKLGIAVRTVANWHSNPQTQLSNELQQALDTLLSQANDDEKKRFAAAAGMSAPQPENIDPRTLERLDSDPNIDAALHWVDQTSGTAPGTARAAVISKLSSISLAEIQARANKRSSVTRQQMAEALLTYYKTDSSNFGTYRVLGDGQDEALTTILTRPEWVGLGHKIPSQSESFAFEKPTGVEAPFDVIDTDRALSRIGETLLAGTRLVNSPIYRLLDTDIGDEKISATMSVIDFIAYALTVDMLEGELAGELSQSSDRPKLPLRDLYLPDVESVMNPRERVCAGGVLALTAIARPADGLRRVQPDYVLLVQERGGQVLNANKKLAVIPKCFHGPLANFREDAPASASLFREMEEELFGRDDVDSTLTKQVHADPMHPGRLSQPMKWLTTSQSGSWDAQYTAFGYNLVSGNYEYACLIAIHNDEFWERFGGDISANWESESLRQYSSLDPEGLSDLLTDPNWSNEGLFAFTQGLSRLAQMKPDRVELPSMNWEVRF